MSNSTWTGDCRSWSKEFRARLSEAAKEASVSGYKPELEERWTCFYFFKRLTPDLAESPDGFSRGLKTQSKLGMISLERRSGKPKQKHGVYLRAFLKTTRIPGSRMSAVSPWALAKA